MAQRKAENKEKWESQDFPILCEPCLGKDEFMRMTKQPFARACKICQRPFTVFRWKVENRFKKTEICVTCAKLKNVCQCCVLDMEFGLPAQIRDAALGIEDQLPHDPINRMFFAQSLEGKELGKEYRGELAGKQLLRTLARDEPYRRNVPKVCSFFLKGTCGRGSDCPYRHEKVDGENETVEERYFGSDEALAKKLLNKAKAVDKTVPSDKAICSLYLSGVEKYVTEGQLRDWFASFGEIKSIVMMPKAKSAFVNYSSRIAAEMAAHNYIGNDIVIEGALITVAWVKPKSNTKSAARPESASPKLDMPPLPGKGNVLYPSQDPNFMGSTPSQLL